MKPIILYTLPRTRGTAALQAAKRETKLNEPIEIYQLAGIDDHNKLECFFETKALNQSYSEWSNLQNTMSDPNTATKFFGGALQLFYPARTWFSTLINQGTHNVYILLRNPREILWSFLIALHYGFNLESEVNVGEIEIREVDFYKADLVIDNFLRFYPSGGEIVTFETLPSENFDKSLITMQEQNSLTSKINFVKNKDEVEKKIDLILKFYQQEWKDKTNTDIISF